MYVGYGQETMASRVPMVPTMMTVAPRPTAAPSTTYLGPSPQPAPPVLVDQVYVDETEEPPPGEGEGDSTGSMLMWGGIVLLAVLGGGAVYMYTRKKR